MYCDMKYIIAIVSCLMAYIEGNASLSFSGNTLSVISEVPETTTGLNEIYVINDAYGVKASYTAKHGNNVRWYRYSNLGGGYAEEITGVKKNGNTYTVELGQDDIGYIIEDGTDRYYYWIVNYANHSLDLQGMAFAAEQDCNRVFLSVTGEGGRIVYYTINGQGKELNRQLELRYRTLRYDGSSGQYNQEEAVTNYPYLSSILGADAPLCDTEFTLSGDRFLKAWGMEQQVETPTYTAVSVDAVTSAEQAIREHDNEKKEEAALGGSAPADISFKAAVSDAAVFMEWQMSKDAGFETIDDRYNSLEMDYTFRENGTTYVRFVANNADGTCEYIGDTYEIFIGESSLECPNAFSPGTSEGVNDEWKVSYKSIISFECHIFNRWGTKMATLTDPSQGWDGKYKGKIVPAGVYYYVIKAEGSDGKDYSLSGDINIIKSRVSSTGTSSTESSE